MAGETMISIQARYLKACCPVVVLVGCLVLACQTAAFAQDETPAPPAAGEPAADGQSTAKPAESDASADSESPEAKAEAEAGEKTEVEPEPEPPLPFPLRPYSVAVEVAFSENCLPYDDQQQDVIRDIRNAVRRIYGPMWDADVRSGNWLLPGSEARIASLTEPELIERYPCLLYTSPSPRDS